MSFVHHPSLPFAHRWCADVCCDLCASLEAASFDAEVWSNVQSEGLRCDAVVLCGGVVWVVLFCQGGGLLRCNDRGQWTADGRVVPGALGCKNPALLADRLCHRWQQRLPQASDVRACVCFAGSVSFQPDFAPAASCCTAAHMAEMIRPSARSRVDAALRGRLLVLLSLPPSSAPESVAPPLPASEWVDQMLAAASDTLSPSQRSDVLRQLLLRAVDSRLSDTTLLFSGLFAKIDYLVKELALSQHDTYGILRARHNLFDATSSQSDFYWYDYRDVCLFVARLFDCNPLPPQVTRRFPQGDMAHSWGSFQQNVVRVRVVEWDDATILADEVASGLRLHVCYGPNNRYLSREGRGDWSYLSSILRVDAVLNLVRVRMSGDICMPELIIYEPDILINVTTVASCFDDAFCETPFVALLSRLGPSSDSAPIFLGNLSGLLLDAAVHSPNVDFDACYEAFFRNNALSMACCADMARPDAEAALRDAARAQLANIERCVSLWRQQGAAVEEAQTEPSFFSPVLGLQGRFDLLYNVGADAVIVEQKSGRAAFQPGSRPTDVPKPVVKHTVQLLLYRALFLYQFDKYASQLRQLCLLYSKYVNSLVSIGQQPELMLRAVRMRNLLAWCEQLYAHEGFRILDQMTPDKLRGSCSALFWSRWKEPAVRRVLDPLRNASSLEKAYYHRFQRFLAVEQLCGRLGSNQLDDRGFASLWLENADVKMATGNIYCALSLADVSETADDTIVSFRPLDAALPLPPANFRRGDIVILYHYQRGSQPHACEDVVLRGSIVGIAPNGLSCRLRSSCADLLSLSESNRWLWAVEHDMMEASSASLFRSIHAFLSAPQSRRDLILLARPPRVDVSLSLCGDYGSVNDLVLRAKRARDLFLVIGPPGTGKTSFALMGILREELLDPHATVLLASYTNRAVDEMCGKMMSAGIDFLRIGNDLSCDPACRPYLAQHRLSQCSSVAEVRRSLLAVRVVCATTAALAAHASLFDIKHFSLLIVDEASQILEPNLVGILAAHVDGRPAVDRVVMIGDHKQLPAVVQQPVSESRINDAVLLAAGFSDCRCSMFERLLGRFRLDDGGYRPDNVYMLTHQGRMHPAIADFPSHAFYRGLLLPAGLPHQAERLPDRSDLPHGIRRMLQLHAIAFVALPAPDHPISDKVNDSEARAIAATLWHIYCENAQSFDPAATAGVIVPYRHQIAAVRQAVADEARSHHAAPDLCHRLCSVTIDTVERYQGGQQDYILYGFTVQHRYQLNFLAGNTIVEAGCHIDRKLNVAMTRARRRLILFGNPDVLSFNPVYSSLMGYLRQRQAFFDLDVDTYCSGRF